jgi:hypothetical protein
MLPSRAPDADHFRVADHPPGAFRFSRKLVLSQIPVNSRSLIPDAAFGGRDSNRIEASETKAQPNTHWEAKATAPVLDSTSLTQ